MGKAQFFEEPAEQSEVKSAIVAKYFWAWANVVKGAARKHGKNIAYVDLFAGPGRYKDGTKSTPLLILGRVVEDPELRSMFVSMFNDANADHSSSLQKEIDAIPGIEKLQNKPRVYNHEVGEEIVRLFEQTRLVPTLFFVDPWGYKGLSLRLVDSVLKDWGCDCIFFFNYTRINMGLRNQLVAEHMNALFGTERADLVREQIANLNPRDTELAIVEAIGEALQGMGGKYVLPFRFRRLRGSQTSHHLIFVSKHIRGYDIMKEIMAKESSSADQGVSSFEYNPSIRRQGLLFELSRPLDDLADMLCREFCHKTMTMKQIFDAHQVGRPFVRKNYKHVLISLEKEGKIQANPSTAQRRKNTFADHVRVTFT